MVRVPDRPEVRRQAPQERLQRVPLPDRGEEARVRRGDLGPRAPGLGSSLRAAAEGWPELRRQGEDELLGVLRGQPAEVRQLPLPRVRQGWPVCSGRAAPRSRSSDSRREGALRSSWRWARRSSCSPRRPRPRGRCGRCSRTTPRSCGRRRRAASGRSSRSGSTWAPTRCASRSSGTRSRRCRRRARSRPSTRSNPAAYPGFFPYDDLITRARALGMRIIVTITGDAPRWATAGGRGRNAATSNLRGQRRRVRALRDGGREALLRQVRRAARGALLHDLERAEPPELPEAHVPGAARVPADGRHGVAADPAQRARRSARCSWASWRLSAERRSRWGRRSSCAGGSA